MVTNTIPHESKALKIIVSAIHELTVYPDSVVIRYTDFLSRLIQREKVIPLTEIRAVHLYASRFTHDPYIQLSIIDKDDNPVNLWYNIKQLAEVQGAKRQIENRLAYA